MGVAKQLALLPTDPRLGAALLKYGAGAAHQPGCVLASNVNAPAAQHVPHLLYAVDVVIFGNERRDYAPRGQRREDCGRLSPGPWIGGIHAS